MKALSLRQEGGELRDGEARTFCTRAEWDAIHDPSWRGIPPIVIQRTLVAPGDAESEPLSLRVVWMDARGIDTPETFRVRLLGLSAT